MKGHSISITYNDDGQYVQVGDLVVERNEQTGKIEQTTLGVVTDKRTYDSFGDLETYEVIVNNTLIYEVNYLRDKLGRVTEKTETLEGRTQTFGYAYDLEGRLIGVTLNGTQIGIYTYDANGNRFKSYYPCKNLYSHL